MPKSKVAVLRTNPETVLDDYVRLKSRRSDDIPDAEIIETDGD
mgnify:CR=1 FL=1